MAVKAEIKAPDFDPDQPSYPEALQKYLDAQEAVTAVSGCGAFGRFREMR